MKDEVFGELSYGDYDSWEGKHTLDFGGNTYTIDLSIRVFEDEEEITQRQKVAFRHFIEKWHDIQEKLIKSLIQYYNEEVRFSYGPDDEEEYAEYWPEINTKEALLQAVTLEDIVVGYDFHQKDPICIYLLFSRAWGGEDYDDNGIGVCFINEEIDEIAYKDIAY